MDAVKDIANQVMATKMCNDAKAGFEIDFSKGTSQKPNF